MRSTVLEHFIREEQKIHNGFLEHSTDEDSKLLLSECGSRKDIKTWIIYKDQEYSFEEI